MNHCPSLDTMGCHREERERESDEVIVISGGEVLNWCARGSTERSNKEEEKRRDWDRD